MADSRPFFLDVDRSVTGRAWVDRLDAAEVRAAGAIAQQAGLSEILSRIIAARGITPADAARYLMPTIRELMPDPSTLTDMDKAAERLVAAINRKESVALFGDYDVDGAAS